MAYVVMAHIVMAWDLSGDGVLCLVGDGVLCLVGDGVLCRAGLLRVPAHQVRPCMRACARVRACQSEDGLAEDGANGLHFFSTRSHACMLVIDRHSLLAAL